MGYLCGILVAAAPCAVFISFCDGIARRETDMELCQDQLLVLVSTMLPVDSLGNGPTRSDVRCVTFCNPSASFGSGAGMSRITGQTGVGTKRGGMTSFCRSLDAFVDATLSQC